MRRHAAPIFEPRPEWMKRAACRDLDPAIFYPTREDGTLAARMHCLSCPVRHECLDYALTHNEKFGVWGATSEGVRRRMKREGRVAQ